MPQRLCVILTCLKCLSFDLLACLIEIIYLNTPSVPILSPGLQGKLQMLSPDTCSQPLVSLSSLKSAWLLLDLLGFLRKLIDKLSFLSLKSLQIVVLKVLSDKLSFTTIDRLMLFKF
jgi:hypothetical protein